MRYLTKWELYVILRGRASSVPFSPVVYCFKISKYLPTLKTQSFFRTEPNISDRELRRICYLREPNTRVSDLAPDVQFVVRLSNKELVDWLKGYLQEYQEGRLYSIQGEVFCSHEYSMRYTLDLLKQYSKINSQRIVFKDTLDNIIENPPRINDKARLYEDIMVLAQMGYIGIGVATLDNRKISFDMEPNAEVPSFSVLIRFNKSIEEIESLLRTNPMYANLPVSEQPKTENIETHKILQELKAAVAQVQPQNNDKDDGPNFYLGLRIENRKIYYKDNPLPMQFREDSKEIKLLKHLIKQKGRPTHRDDLIDIVGLTSKKNKERSVDVWGNEERRGPKKDVRKRNLDKLRHIINVVSDKLSEVNITIIKMEKRCITLKKLDK